MNEVCVENTKPLLIISIKQQYNLKHGIFDPLQNSPPSVWKDRLLKRIKQSNNVNM